MKRPNKAEWRRQKQSEYQAKFDFEQDQKQEKLKWIKEVIMPMLEDV